MEGEGGDVMKEEEGILWREGKGILGVLWGRGRDVVEEGGGDIVEGGEEMRGMRCGGRGMLWVKGEGTLWREGEGTLWREGKE